MYGHRRIASSFLLMTAVGLNAARADQGPPPPRLITVTGSAEIKVAPDEVVISVGVVTLNKDVGKSKQENDERTKRVFEIAKKLGVEDKYIQTDHVRIGPDYEYRSEKRVFLGYNVTQIIAITLRDIDKYEPLVTELVNEDVDHVNGVEFRLAESRLHKDLARKQAIRAAKEKALALASELGQGIGRPNEIIENTGEFGDFFAPWRGNRSASMSNVVSAQSGAGESADVLAPGQIVVRAGVTVSFELVDAD